MTTLLKNARIVSPLVDITKGHVLIDNGRIIQVTAGNDLPAADETFDLAGKILVPGFIDMHFHGGMGYETTSDKPEAVRVICEAKLREGVTSLCPTTLTLSEEMLANSLRNIEKYRLNPTGSKVLGTHLEGPYINPQCVGAQNPAYLRSPDIEEIKRLNAISPVSVVTYAIELEGSLEFTRQLRALGIVPSCGHTKATYEQFIAGFPCGMERVTHFCNVTTPLHHRKFGVVGAGFLHDNVAVEVICDKIHLCPEMIKMVFKFKTRDKILMITDAMEAAGLPDGDFQLGGLPVIVKDGVARLTSDGTIAGSTLQYDKGLRNVLEVTGLTLPEVIQATSWNQARNLGLTDLGKIEPGFLADLTVLDSDLLVASVFCDGIRKF